MNVFQGFALGIVEGLTEFLPVSSTGHLILASHWLGIPSDEAADAFDVVIQSAAMFAVIWHYRILLRDLFKGLLARRRDSMRLTLSLVLAFIPAAVIGLLVHKKVKALLFGPLPVAAALVVGGIAMIIIERYLERRARGVFQFTADQDPGPAAAVKIGFAQCLALWPGTSRSMATILGGRLVGLSSRKAAEFSFLLAIPTLLAAAALDLYKHGGAIAEHVGIWPALAGLVSSFVVALAVLRVFLEFLRSYSLEVFGWYRILLGILVWLVL